jgi:hypothetical protein
MRAEKSEGTFLFANHVKDLAEDRIGEIWRIPTEWRNNSNEANGLKLDNQVPSKQNLIKLCKGSIGHMRGKIRPSDKTRR